MNNIEKIKNSMVVGTFAVLGMVLALVGGIGALACIDQTSNFTFVRTGYMFLGILTAAGLVLLFSLLIAIIISD